MNNENNGGTLTLIMLQADHERLLKQAHEAFCEHPGPLTAGELAGAAEKLLEILEAIKEA